MAVTRVDGWLNVSVGTGVTSDGTEVTMGLVGVSESDTDGEVDSVSGVVAVTVSEPEEPVETVMVCEVVAVTLVVVMELAVSDSEP